MFSALGTKHRIIVKNRRKITIIHGYTDKSVNKANWKD